MLFKLLGMLPKSQQSKLLGSVMGMLGGGGGLGAILGKFTQAGLGGKADSWVGSGPNAKLTGKEVRNVLGDAEIARIAQESGVSPRQASNGLAKLLPQAIDKLSPQGQALEGDGLQDMLGKLGGLLG